MCWTKKQDARWDHWISMRPMLSQAVASPEFWLRRGGVVFLWYCIAYRLFWRSRCPFSKKIKYRSFIFSYFYLLIINIFLLKQWHMLNIKWNIIKIFNQSYIDTVTSSNKNTRSLLQRPLRLICVLDIPWRCTRIYTQDIHKLARVEGARTPVPHSWRRHWSQVAYSPV